MAQRYAVEVNRSFLVYTVHHGNCPNLSRQELTPLSKLNDMGVHEDDHAALAKARKAFPSSWECEHCDCMSRVAFPLKRARPASNLHPIW